MWLGDHTGSLGTFQGDLWVQNYLHSKAKTLHAFFTLTLLRVQWNFPEATRCVMTSFWQLMEFVFVYSGVFYSRCWGHKEVPFQRLAQCVLSTTRLFLAVGDYSCYNIISVAAFLFNKFLFLNPKFLLQLKQKHKRMRYCLLTCSSNNF